MATLITKNSSTASAVPAAGDLVKGELAVNVTDKKVYTKDNSAAVVKLVGSLGNQEANAVAITGGAINGTTIGATTPSTGAFTTASASGGFTGNLTGNVTGNVSGTAANVTGVVAIANGGTGLSALGTGVQSALGQAVTGSGSFVLSTSPSLTTPNLGTPSAAVLTNATGLPLTTGVTGTLGVANGGTGITAFGTGVATALGQNVTGSGGIVLATSPSLTTPNLGTPSAATLTNATGLPISTGVSGLGTGVATALAVNTGSAGAFVVNGGALGTPSSGTLTNCTGYPTSALSGSINLATQVTGTLATTNGGTGLTSFTANGVVYASSTSALTTGSALSFDGTNLLQVNAAAGKLRLGVNTSDQFLDIYRDNVSGASVYNAAQGSGFGFHVWQVANTEAMRLTSTGLGIGTSSPAAKLDVTGGSSTGGFIVNGSVASVRASSTVIDMGDSNRFLALGPNTTTAGTFKFIVASSNASVYNTAATIDTSGNLGIGTSSPLAKLDVNGGIAPTAAPSSNWGLDFAPSSSSGTYVTIANNGTYDLATGSGTVFLYDEAANGVAQLICYYGTTGILFQNGTLYTTTSGTANKVNFFYNGGTGKYRIENKFGSSLNIWISTIRTRLGS